MIRCDLHVHTDRDHGRHSAADMAAQAVRQGLHTLGLVGHAAMQVPCDYAMTPESEALFFAETAQLKQSYAQHSQSPTVTKNNRQPSKRPSAAYGCRSTHTMP